jgi:predicted transcriptional regulator
MAKLQFGQLEQAIMNVVWVKPASTVREVLDQLPPQRRAAYTTVMTVMNRLVAQRVLRRTLGRGGAFTYSAVQSRDAFLVDATHASIDQLVRQYGDAALVQFMAALDDIPAEKLARLKKLSKKS